MYTYTHIHIYMLNYLIAHIVERERDIHLYIYIYIYITDASDLFHAFDQAAHDIFVERGFALESLESQAWLTQT